VNAKRQVIFLGAGASAADGAPIQSQLFSEFFSLPSSEISCGHLEGFFRDFFGIDVTSQNRDVQYPPFEEILGILELAIARGESFRGYPLVPQDPKIQLVREELIFLIARILKEKLAHRPTTNHRSLVHRLLKSPEQLRSTTFISLNYDILIDNALTDAHGDVDLDYGIDFANFHDQRGWHRPREKRSVELLKLHGSLNWLYCPTCTSIRITPKEKRISTIADKPLACDQCDTRIIPIIIPPTFLKVMGNHHLQRIWKIAEERLSECDRILFCGYSFPDADLHIRYLLKRIEVNQGKTPEIYIFNDHPGKPERTASEERQRYERFFRNRKSVHFLNMSFQNFCCDGLPSNSEGI
jgi:NAD-dependent SIR2 family protein deacetylase